MTFWAARVVVERQIFGHKSSFTTSLTVWTKIYTSVVLRMNAYILAVPLAPLLVCGAGKRWTILV